MRVVMNAAWRSKLMRTCKICGVKFQLVGPFAPAYEGTTPEGIRFSRSRSVCSEACREKRVAEWVATERAKGKARTAKARAANLRAYRTIAAEGPFTRCACGTEFVTIPAAYRETVSAPDGIRLSGSERVCSATCSRKFDEVTDERNPARFVYDNGPEQVAEKRRLIEEGD